MVRGRDADGDAGELGDVTGLDLANVAEAAPAEHAPGTARHDDRHVPADLAQGRNVEMVVVQVRDEHAVDPWDCSGRLGATQVHGAAAQQRVQ